MSDATIRPLEREDLPRVAAIFQNTFRRDQGPPSLALALYLRELFIDHPARDPETRSLVHIRRDGVVDGFIGALPQPMVFQGRRLRGVVGTGLMVEDPGVSPAAGANLLRRLLNGPQDITMTDTANRRASDLQRALKCRTLGIQSLQWTKILRAASSVASVLSDRIRPLREVPLWRAARLLDPAFGSSPSLYYRTNLDRKRWSDADISHEEFARIYLALAEEFPLRPGWSSTDLVWLLGQAARKTRYGTMVVRGVYAANARPLGAYLYFGRPGGKAVVLQIINGPAAADAVLTSLFDHALVSGCAMVQGTAQPYLMDGLCRGRGVIFRHECATNVRARDPALLEALHGDNVLLGGLAGEHWTLLVSDGLHDRAPGVPAFGLKGRLGRALGVVRPKG